MCDFRLNINCSNNQRRYVLLSICGFFGTGLAACTYSTDENNKDRIAAKNENVNISYFNVNLYSYLERPIFDVTLNGRHIGVAGGQPHRGRGGIITGVPVPLGNQKITWRLGSTGETIHAINNPFLERIDSKFTYLGVHIYPDNSVELVPEQFWPEPTERGMEINRQWERNNE